MNIIVLIILFLLFYKIIYDENNLIKKELYTKKTIRFLKKIDKKLDTICYKNNISKIYEFSLKLSKNKVNNIRYAYGIILPLDKKNNYVSILEELNISNEFKKMIFKKYKNTSHNVTGIYISHDLNESANRIYIDTIPGKKNVDKYDPSIISFEKKKGKIFTRYYTSKKISNYLTENFMKCGEFGRILNKYIPNHKIRLGGYKFNTTSTNNIESFRFFLKEYNKVSDLQDLILDLAYFFKMDNNNLIKVRQWLYYFKNNEVNIFAVTLYPEYNFTIYTREVTEYV